MGVWLLYTTDTIICNTQSCHLFMRKMALYYHLILDTPNLGYCESSGQLESMPCGRGNLEVSGTLAGVIEGTPRRGYNEESLGGQQGGERFRRPRLRTGINAGEPDPPNVWGER